MSIATRIASGVAALVVMAAALEERDPPALDRADDQPSRVALDARHRKAGQLAVGDGDRVLASSANGPRPEPSTMPSGGSASSPCFLRATIAPPKSWSMRRLLSAELPRAPRVQRTPGRIVPARDAYFSCGFRCRRRRQFGRSRG